jgi:hypothetical protein
LIVTACIAARQPSAFAAALSLDASLRPGRTSCAPRRSRDRSMRHVADPATAAPGARAYRACIDR